jgi:flagellar motor switch protein FliN/FliY
MNSINDAYHDDADPLGHGAEGTGGAANLETILGIPVTVQVVLGTTTMPVARLMKLGRGAIISLDQKVGDPVNVLVNGRVVAKGEVVVVDEESSRFGVTLTEIVHGARAS